MKLGLTELAECLNLPLYTVERWIRQGRIPVRRTGNQCVFKRAVLEKWAEKHHIRFCLPDSDRQATTPEKGEKDTLLAALERGGLHVNITGSTVEEVLKQAVQCIPEFSDEEKEVLYDKLLERERLTSTGIGKGVAIPHPRSPLTGTDRDSLICACFLEQGIDFGALDDKLVTVMFVMVCPNVKSHLHLLSRLSFCLRDDTFVQSLNNSLSPDEFFKKIEEVENRLEKAGK